MSFVSSIDILFYSQVFTCCIVDCTTIFNSCCYCRSCSIICHCTTISSCISFEAVVVTTSWDVQVGEVDNCFSISYCFTIAIVVSQCNFLSSCIVFVYVFSTGSYTAFSFSATRFNCCRSDVQFRSFQGIMCGFQLIFCSCLTRYDIVRIECFISQTTDVASFSVQVDWVSTTNCYCFVRTECDFTRASCICNGGDIC